MHGPITAETTAPEIDVAIRRASLSDAEAIRGLLSHAGLTTEAVLSNLHDHWVACHRQALVAVAAVERCGDECLLRSVAVAPGWRRRHLGRMIVREALSSVPVSSPVYLFTEAAAAFFRSLGFVETERGALPSSIAASPQATSLCPATAIAMVSTDRSRE